MVNKVIDDDLIIIELRITSAETTQRGIICDFEETYNAGRNLYNIIDRIISSYQKRLNIGGSIKKDLYIKNEEIKILAYFEQDKNQGDMVGDHAVALQKLFHDTITDVEKIYSHHSTIVDSNKTPNIQITNSQNIGTDSVIFDENETIFVSNPTSVELAEEILKCNTNLGLIDNSLLIGNEVRAFPIPTKNINYQKAVDKESIIKFNIRITSVSSDTSSFTFKKPNNSKTYKGKTESIKMRKNLMKHQHDDNIIIAEFHPIYKNGLVKKLVDEYELISIESK
jgi:hypothetical protein